MRDEFGVHVVIDQFLNIVGLALGAGVELTKRAVGLSDTRSGDKTLAGK